MNMIPQAKPKALVLFAFDDGFVKQQVGDSLSCTAIGAEYMTDTRKAFSRLAAAATRTSDELWSHRQVIRHVEALTKTAIVNFDDVCQNVNAQISKQTHLLSGGVVVDPLIYQDSEMPSPFADRFTRYFEKTGNGTTSEHLRLRSTCWENGDEVTIRAIVRNVKTGAFLGSAVVRYLKSQQRDVVAYKPRGYDQVQVEKQAFKPWYYRKEKVERSGETSKTEALTEHMSAPIDGLEVDVWTGEGREHVVYTEGDRVKIFVRVNQPVYLRLLYTLADQRRTLLIDNFQIGPSAVNRPVEVGSFRCIPPLGTEFLVVAARTEKFPAIQTRRAGDYDLLVDEDVASAAASFRGLPRGLVRIPDDSSEPQNHNSSIRQQTMNLRLFSRVR